MDKTFRIVLVYSTNIRRELGNEYLDEFPGQWFENGQISWLSTTGPR
jgi:hypothetical protein